MTYSSRAQPTCAEVRSTIPGGNKCSIHNTFERLGFKLTTTLPSSLVIHFGWLRHRRSIPSHLCPVAVSTLSPVLGDVEQAVHHPQRHRRPAVASLEHSLDDVYHHLSRQSLAGTQRAYGAVVVMVVRKGTEKRRGRSNGGRGGAGGGRGGAGVMVFPWSGEGWGEGDSTPRVHSLTALCTSPSMSLGKEGPVIRDCIAASS